MTSSTPPVRQPRAHTKIVATIGPASEDRIGEMIDAGLSVARINFSHGTLDDHRRRVEKVRGAARERMTAVGILADLPGPKIRAGHFPGGEIALEQDVLVTLRGGSGEAAPGEVLVDLNDLARILEPGHRVALADGQVELLVESISGDEVLARVSRAGRVGDRKGVHLPDSAIPLHLPTDRDREFIDFALELGVDMLGLSFVGAASEIEEIRALAGELLLVAKIERLAAIENLDEVIAASDGIMVARGDLGVELDLVQVPVMQKTLIQSAVRAGKFSITATEMLESMISSSRPTRAEVSDVANAVLDGTDAVMLSAETAVGEYPVQAVRTMQRIARAVERAPRYRQRPRLVLAPGEANFSNATAMAAANVANTLGLDKIVCFTETGNTVRLISRFCPDGEIVALSPDPRTVARMTVLAHVRPLLFRRETNLEDMLFMAVEMLLARGMVRREERVVFVAGVPPAVARSTNVMKLHRIGEEIKLS